LLPVGRIHAGWWVLVAALVLAADDFVGVNSQLPTLYAIPVALAAWYSGRWPAVALATAVPVFHIILVLTVMSRTEGAVLLATMTAAPGGAGAWEPTRNVHHESLGRRLHSRPGPNCVAHHY